MTPAACLVTGATGYVGGRLVPQLLAQGHRVRVMARHPEKLRDVPWLDDVEVVSGDAGDAEAVARAMAGMDVAYYLLHSIQEGPGLEDTERRMAQTFADAARSSGLRRIVYLGGLAPEIPPARMSPHMRSRVEVGQVLRTSGVPVAEFRAAVIIGSGLGQLRDAALPDRAAPRDDHAHLGAAEDAADRHPRRAPLPRRGGGPPLDRQPAAGDRRTRGAHLPGDDEAVRRGGRPAPARDHADQPAHPRAVEPLGQRGHPRAPGDRPAAGAVAAAPVGLPRARRRPVDPRSPRRPRLVRRRRAPRAHRASATPRW